MSLPYSEARYEVEVVDALPPRDTPRPPLRAATGDGEAMWIVAVAGETLLRALQRADSPVLSICGGQASCGACRVEIAADWLTRVPDANTVEAALLDALDGPAPSHRLACQLAITPALAGLRLTLAPRPTAPGGDLQMNVAMKQPDFEAVGEAFDADKMFEQRDRTREVIGAIAAAVRPGMVEEDAVAMAKAMLAKRKMLRGWHDVYVRFGTNTTKTFGAASDPGIVLGDDDIFLIDVGPVFEKWEGDGGDTFVTGDDPDMARCAVDARALFHTVRRRWLTEGLSGQALYVFAVEEAAKLGWELNMDLSGHRISDFPHAVIYDGPMADVEFTPSAGLWVLEIHIRHPEKPFGAFFEDMLLDDRYFPDAA